MMPSATFTTAPPAFDKYAVLLEFGSDVVFIRHLANLLSASLPAYVADLLAAAGAGDEPRVAKVAHAIRGSVGNIYADRLAGLAGLIERSARQSRSIDPSLIDDLAEAVEVLLSEFVLWAETLVERKDLVRDWR